jgi:filamentous hemagglutinin
VSGDSRRPHPNALPNYRKAVIPPDKLVKYALSATHIAVVWGKSSGKDKARVFKSVLGFDESNWELLRDKILDELPYYEALVDEEDQYGRRYTVTMKIVGVTGTEADVLTAWIIRPGEDGPSLTSTRCLT